MQNLTGHELDSIVTRLGDNCKVILCGDSTQSDFVKSTDKNGLPKFLSIIGKLNTFAFIEFFEQDIVRSGFVKDYIIEKNKQSIQF
jgi:phosphate starvation-inducible PhoH-like protein